MTGWHLTSTCSHTHEHRHTYKLAEEGRSEGFLGDTLEGQCVVHLLLIQLFPFSDETCDLSMKQSPATHSFLSSRPPETQPPFRDLTHLSEACRPSPRKHSSLSGCLGFLSCDQLTSGMGEGLGAGAVLTY